MKSCMLFLPPVLCAVARNPVSFWNPVGRHQIVNCIDFFLVINVKPNLCNSYFFELDIYSLLRRL